MAATPATKKATKKVIIHSNDRENDEKEVIGTYNGIAFQIPIGQEYDIPEGILGVLKDAQEVKHKSEIKDGLPTGKTVEVKVPRYIIEQV